MGSVKRVVAVQYAIGMTDAERGLEKDLDQHRGIEDDIFGKGGGEGLRGRPLDDLQPTMPWRQIPLRLLRRPG